MIFLSCSFCAVYLPLPRRKGYWLMFFEMLNFLNVIARRKQLPYFGASILRVTSYVHGLFATVPICERLLLSFSLYRFARVLTAAVFWTSILRLTRTCMVIARSLPLSQFANDNSPRFTRSSRLYVVTFSLPLRSCVNSCRLLNVDLTGDVERAWSLPGHCRCHNLRMVILLASLVAPAYTLSRLSVRPDLVPWNESSVAHNVWFFCDDQ